MPTPEQQAALDMLDAEIGELTDVGDYSPDSAAAPAAAPAPAGDPPPSEAEPFDDPNASPLERLAMDEPVFAGGPTRAQIEAFKLKYPHSSILALLLADNRGLIYRTLTRAEWKGIQHTLRGQEDADKREEFIFSKIVLHPDCSNIEVVGTLPAGAVTSVMQEFYVYSGFQPIAESLKL
jgi:hypothetical protein